MSRRQLLRKLRALTDETPVTLIRRLRLERASVLLGEGLTAKEVAFTVGFRSYAPFSRAFSDAYGMPPSEYVRQLQKKV